MFAEVTRVVEVGAGAVKVPGMRALAAEALPGWGQGYLGSFPSTSRWVSPSSKQGLHQPKPLLQRKEYGSLWGINHTFPVVNLPDAATLKYSSTIRFMLLPHNYNFANYIKHNVNILGNRVKGSRPTG